jgi:NhaP-type Na+/H+ or K+/H+ antiporter
VVVRLDARPGNGLAAAFASALTGRKNAMEFLWVLLGVLYFALMVTLGVMTFRGGHYWLFGLGIFFPVLWMIGALIAPTEAAASRHAPAASSP